MGFPAERIETGNDTPPVECTPATPSLTLCASLRVVVREDDLRRWAALCVETADYLAGDVRMLPTEAAVRTLDDAGDALREAALALWALRAEARKEVA